MILCSTDPNKPFESLVPQDLRGAVADVVFTTNRLNPDELLLAGEIASARRCRLVLDSESLPGGKPNRAALDVWTGNRADLGAADPAAGRQAVRAALDKTASDLDLLRSAYPALRIGVYDKLPPKLGFEPPTLADYDELAAVEAETLLGRVDFVVNEAYTEPVSELYEFANALQFEKLLRFNDAQIRKNGYRREVVVLLASRYVGHPSQPLNDRPIPPGVFAAQLDMAARFGTRCLFNPGPEAWGVIRGLTELK